MCVSYVILSVSLEIGTKTFEDEVCVFRRCAKVTLPLILIIFSFVCSQSSRLERKKRKHAWPSTTAPSLPSPNLCSGMMISLTYQNIYTEPNTVIVILIMLLVHLYELE